MTTCCDAGGDVTDARAQVRCPRNGKRGAAVGLLTVKAMLSEPALGRVAKGPYRFCADPDCPVVYFDCDQRVFTTGDLRGPVWQKRPSGERTICYCFGETEASITREIAATGSCGAPARIREHIAAGRCACEVRNPRGVCCLGDLNEFVSRISAELASAD
jgi:Zinc binding domain